MVNDSLRLEAARKHFVQEMKNELQSINRIKIQKALPKLKREEILKFAGYVATIRAAYLSKAYNLIRHDDSPLLYLAEVIELKKLREIYEETSLSYTKILYAIEKEYIEIEDL